MIPVYELAILALASGRVSYSFPNEDIWAPIRDRIFLWSPPDSTDKDGRPYRLWHKDGASYTYDEGTAPRDKGFIGSLLACPWCLSFWVSVGMTLLWLVFGSAFTMLMVPFALWGLATAFAKWLNS